VVKEARFLLDTPYPSGMTSIFAVTVADGEPRLGPHVGGPLPVGLDWVPLPGVRPNGPGLPIPPLIVALPMD